MMNKKLAIIGASYLQLPLVMKAKELGLRTFCFAWEDGAICKDYVDIFYPISILEKDEILEVCRSLRIDGIVTIASDTAVTTVNYVAENLNLISNPYEFSDITTNKYLMRESFKINNIPSPQFLRYTEGESIIDILELKYPLIVKPTDRSGSRGVTKVNSELELNIAIDRAKEESFSKDVIVEEYVMGKEISVETISWKGMHYILAITDKVTTGEPYFVELEHHQPSMLSPIIQNKIKDVVFSALDALHIENGASHSELMIDRDNNFSIIEIGARMGGDFIGSDLVFLSTGYDFLKGVIQVALGMFEEPVLNKRKFAGVYFLSEETLYLKSFIENSSSYPQIVKAEITDDKLKRLKSSGDRSGYLIYQGSERLYPRQ